MSPTLFDLLTARANETREEIGRRLLWARRRGHPYYLWPEVEPDNWRAAVGTITDVTNCVLAGDAPPPLAPDSIPAFGVAAFTTGMGPLLGLWHQNNVIYASEDLAPVLRAHLTHSHRRWDRASHLARTLTDTLHDLDIRPLFFKGVHTAQTYFAIPAARPMTDIDLVVPPAKLNAVRTRLQREHFVASRVLPSPYREEWTTGPEAQLRSVFLNHADNPLSVDLHTSVSRVFAGVREVDLTADLNRTPFTALHPHADKLDDTSALLVLTLNASDDLHQLQLIKLYELAILARSPAVDWDRFSQVLQRHNALHFCYPSIFLLHELSPQSIPTEIMDQLHRSAPARMRGVMARLHPNDVQRLDHRSLSERLMWATSWWDLARGAVNVFRPQQTTSTPWHQAMRERAYRVLRGRVTWR